MKIFIFLLMFLTPSFALIGGKDNRDPEGFRKHVVTLRFNSGSHCSGVVLSKRLVLTAAHCFARGGGVYVGYLNPSFLTQRVNVAAVSLHPNYNPVVGIMKHHIYDLALVHLAADLPSMIVAVEFPASPPLIKENITLVGFGLSDGNRNDSALVLRELPLKIADFAKERGEINFTPTGALMTTPGNGSCKGDSGGPALRLNTTTKKYEVVGISSWSSGPSKANTCGLKSIYTDVYSEKQWILVTAKNWGLNLP